MNYEVGMWGSGEAVSSPYQPKTLSPQNPITLSPLNFLKRET
ncbi:hypothetical protein [Microcystis aeruginosa]|nr:hypothetical protein [Microcystis aeruginosa]MDB9416986.1 hypothetical protein [Microcystis aeruginosa CS-556/03]